MGVRVAEHRAKRMVRALLGDRPLKGTWYNRTNQYAARLLRKKLDPRTFATEYSVVLSQLPCMRELSSEAYREFIAGLVREIENEAAAERALTGREPLGAEAILRQHPHTRPNRTKKSPAPLFHAATKEMRQELRAAYGRFLAAFREAAERWQAGDRLARFPEGSFPPGLPFVRLCLTASP